MTSIRSLLLGIAIAIASVACGNPGQSASPSDASLAGIDGVATAGPVCPVETTPPDPACAPRPVAGAVLIARDQTGREIGRTTTAADGTFFLALEPGAYVLEPQPVAGMMGTAPPVAVAVNPAARTTVEIVYDTGIRGPAPAP